MLLLCDIDIKHPDARLVSSGVLNRSKMYIMKSQVCTYYHVREVDLGKELRESSYLPKCDNTCAHVVTEAVTHIENHQRRQSRLGRSFVCVGNLWALFVADDREAIDVFKEENKHFEVHEFPKCFPPRDSCYMENNHQAVCIKKRRARELGLMRVSNMHTLLCGALPMRIFYMVLEFMPCEDLITMNSKRGHKRKRVFPRVYLPKGL